MLDTLLCVMSFSAGVIRGAARQTLGVLVNLCAYWAFGIPLSLGLGFLLGWGVRGFWIGMAVTTTVQVRSNPKP